MGIESKEDKILGIAFTYLNRAACLSIFLYIVLGEYEHLKSCETISEIK